MIEKVLKFMFRTFVGYMMIMIFGMAAGFGLLLALDEVRTANSASYVIKNFGSPAQGIYRGAQPNEEGFKALKDLGVKTIINFRLEQKKIEKERSIVESLNMKFVSIPWDGRSRPQRTDVDQFIEILKDPKNTPVFFHCRRGAERTGVMWASYRVAVDGWDPEKAHEEMKTYKFRSFWFPHLTKFLFDFSKDYGFKKEYTTGRFAKIKEWFLNHIVYMPFQHRAQPA